MKSRVLLDRGNRKLLGVCAGLAQLTGWDPTLVRLIAVLLTLFALGPVGLLIYLLVGLVAESR